MYRDGESVLSFQNEVRQIQNTYVSISSMY